MEEQIANKGNEVKQLKIIRKMVGDLKKMRIRNS